MLSDKETTRLSKLLSLVLRHNPAHLGLTLDEHGWVEVDTLLRQAQAHQVPLTREALVHIVETNAKQRFRFSDDQQRIRASQGHSVQVALGYEPVVPPAVLYHGTTTRHHEQIMREGLRKMSRQQVHLSADVATARQVGSRHGHPVILTIDAAQMHSGGHAFYRADNGVWLTDEVPASYLHLAEGQ
ncbi:RNA 2'-phosphotransferase [Hymenobacter psychrotolerans]|uniref:Probable RNA 2'-phosphotransferase n=1 Tax=Hymenobacter psychrotolerans DSM 18569 TaxID=1121959 RepID=A0A1M6XVN8_9BACT|nr:RNA 2'-phosphotransferase [Hymenobacter psychrotolerans]SHL09923.1 putative RNA 2'-phosphotransferase [Hymenobacter psychrotolerans DSM 18569]